MIDAEGRSVAEQRLAISKGLKLGDRSSGLRVWSASLVPLVLLPNDDDRVSPQSPRTGYVWEQLKKRQWNFDDEETSNLGLRVTVGPGQSQIAGMRPGKQGR